MNRYFKLDAGCNVMPVESTDRHEAVRIENDLLARPLIVSAYHAPKEMNWKAAKKWTEKLDLNGWTWRLPTVEEAFFIPDRSKYPAIDKTFFPDFEGYGWIWTDTVDAEDPAGFAWYVGLVVGVALRDRQTYHGQVRAVRSGQF